MKKYISLPPDAIGMDRYPKAYKNQHSKFIHSSWLLLEDFGREVVMDEKNYTIYGLYDTVGTRVMIMLRPEIPGPFRIEDSKFIAQALGYRRMRNLVTGEEHKWDFVRNKDFFYVTAGPMETVDPEAIGYENPDEDFSSANNQEEEYVDPLVKALQEDLTDDGDSSNLI